MTERMTLDDIIIADTHRDDETFDRLRTECLALMDDLDALKAERDALREALVEYGQHDASCILSQGHSGRPTADGGYEMKYGKHWYSTRPINNTPKCTCGLAEIEKGEK